MPELSNGKYTRYLLIIWLATAALILFLARDMIAHWRMGDPDDELRMVQVRDWVAGQSWFDITQYRMNVPNGGDMHWSRLVDVPLALVIVMATPFFGSASAEQLAGAIVPLITFGAVLFFVASATRRLSNSQSALVAAGLVPMSIPLLAQLRPMRVDHHGWQMVLFLICIDSMLKKDRQKSAAIILGIALATWMNISFEGSVYAVLFMGILGLRWMFDSNHEQDSRRYIQNAATALALSSALLFFATHGISDMKAHCDAIAPAHIAAMLVAAFLLVTLMPPTDRIMFRYHRWAIAAARGFVLLFSAVIGGLLLFQYAPQCLHGSFSDLDPLVREYWYDRVNEGLPVWEQLAPDIARLAGAFFVALIGLVSYLNSNRPHFFDRRCEHLLLMAGTLVIGLFVTRTANYAILLSFVFVAPLIWRLWQMADETKNIARRIILRIAPLMLAIPTIFSPLFLMPLQSSINVAPKAMLASAASCAETKSIVALNTLPRSNLFAPLDSGPAIMLHTPHSIVASGHHRNQGAMKDVIQAFTLPPEQAHAVIARRKIEYVVGCPAAYEMLLYRYNAPGGLWAALLAGHRPDWLVPQKSAGPFRVWRVIDMAGGKQK